VAGLSAPTSGQDERVAQMQPCSAASQAQPGPQAHAGAAMTGPEAAASWQPHVQPAPGQSTHRHEGLAEGTFIAIS